MMALSFTGVFLLPGVGCQLTNANVTSVRIVPGFLVQTGDKTGTGAGGESFYGGS